MPYRIPFVLLALLLASSSGGAGGLLAQRSGAHLLALPQGVKLRVLAPEREPGPITGRLVRTTLDTLHLDRGGPAPDAIPLDRVTGMERSYGRAHFEGALKGFYRGALVVGGALAGAVAAGKEVCPMYESCFSRNPAGAAGAFLLGAFLGAPPGALLGGLIGSEEWGTVGWRLRVDALSPRGGAAGIPIRIP